MAGGYIPPPPLTNVESGQRRRRWLEKRWAFKPRCFYCNRKTVWNNRAWVIEDRTDLDATVDHFMPFYLGGLDDASNWVLACYQCNLLKGSLDPHEFLAELREWGIR